MILDNLSTHKTRAVSAFLETHPQVHLHFTPTYASWLNQVELWFGRIERELLTRGVFTSVKDLARQIRRYIRHYNDVAKPIRWSTLTRHGALLVVLQPVQATRQASESRRSAEATCPKEHTPIRRVGEQSIDVLLVQGSMVE